jgi:hypothetical protein
MTESGEEMRADQQDAYCQEHYGGFMNMYYEALETTGLSALKIGEDPIEESEGWQSAVLIAGKQVLRFSTATATTPITGESIKRLGKDGIRDYKNTIMPQYKKCVNPDGSIPTGSSIDKVMRQVFVRLWCIAKLLDYEDGDELIEPEEEEDGDIGVEEEEARQLREQRRAKIPVPGWLPKSWILFKVLYNRCLYYIHCITIML